MVYVLDGNVYLMPGTRMAPANMEVNALVLTIVEKAGQVPGRTSLQKLSYFANEILVAGIGFRPHYYGPYSPEIAGVADVLVAANLLKEDLVNGLYFRSGRNREWTRHTYSLTEDGKKYLSWLSARGGFPEDEVRDLVEKLKAETNLDPENLSKLAKVRFISDQLGNRSPNPVEVSRTAKGLGWALPPAVARKSLITLDRLGL